MPEIFRIILIVAGVVSALCCGSAAAERQPLASTTVDTDGDEFTPVTASIMGTTPAIVAGSDGLDHLVYELILTNAKQATATLQQVDVLDVTQVGQPLRTYRDGGILDGLRTLQPDPASSTDIEFNASRLLFVELGFEPGKVPQTISHRLELLGAANPGPNTPATAMDYRVATFDPVRSPLPQLAPPLEGNNWVAVNGCCNSDIVHRGSFQTVNGGLYDAQRFAIDYMQLNDKGEFVHGNADDVRNFEGYSANVLAVSDGTVVSTLDKLEDQAPGTLPDPSTISLETVDGNHVVLDIGNGRYAFYAHLMKGSVRVKPGDKVTAGMVIGQLGNSGNTSAPHLHFHVMDSPSVLGSNGLPYVIDEFALTGKVDAGKFSDSEALTGSWGESFDEIVELRQKFPMNLDIVEFRSTE